MTLAHTEVSNATPFAVGFQHLSDRSGKPVVVALIKATFAIGDGDLKISETQLPIFPAGKPNGEPGKSSYLHEPETSYFKPNSDIVLIGEAVAPDGVASRLNVEFSIGPYHSRALVFGDRWWERGFLENRLTDPEPFSSIPLVYERAFGGWDKSHPSPEKHKVEPRNPVGVGFQRQFKSGEDRLPAPNIEDPSNLISSMQDRPKPIGFGFVSPNWEPRSALAGTYNSIWEKTRMPLLPVDFDLSFFNAASEGLVAHGYLSGKEPVMLLNCSKIPILSFFLPGIPPPQCLFRVRGMPDQMLSGPLDTVLVNSLENTVSLSWRCHVLLPRGPESLLALSVKQGG